MLNARIATITLILLTLSSCKGQAIAIEDKNKEHSPVPTTASSNEGHNKEARLAIISKLAELSGITSDYGSNYTYIEKSKEEDYLIIQETFSSTTKYKAITPIVDVVSGDIIIDCSYVRSIDEMKTISVGSFCRGQSVATSDSIEDAINEKKLIKYDESAQWLTNINHEKNCVSLSGMTFETYYIVRCQKSESDELTNNISIHIFTKTLSKTFEINGYEFFPNDPNYDSDKLVFWGLNPNSDHEIVKITKPFGPKTSGQNVSFPGRQTPHK